VIKVEVAYATPDKQVILEVDVLPNSTIEDAIQASQILQQFPEIDLATAQVGIFSKRAELTDRLQPRDRVEIYRSLTIDPKEARRLRVKKKSV
jgi:putative ubiquitin-RnfH superfamily antitoxin RatB of RatAB toxin-antitoxin module